MLPKRDFGLWYQWRGAGGVREKEVAVKVKMNPGGKGTGDRWDQFVTDPWISKEPSPSEARTFWLEREVQSLRNTLAPVSHGNPFLHSECWSGLVVFNVVMLVFNPNPSRGPVSLSLGELVMFQRTGRVNPDLAEAIGRAFPGELCHGDRASSSGGLHLKECPGNLRGGSGDSRLQDDGACALNGAHPDVYPGNLLGGCGEVFSQDRAWQRGHGVCPDQLGSWWCMSRQSGFGCNVSTSRSMPWPSGLCSGCSTAWCLPRPWGLFMLHRLYIQKAHIAFVSNHGITAVGVNGGGVDSIPLSWKTGSETNGSKADLPELPSTANPLQVGDWIHIFFLALSWEICEVWQASGGILRLDKLRSWDHGDEWMRNYDRSWW